MAKSDFICKNCKKTATFGWFSSKVRYECPNHGIICKNCVDKKFLKDATCKECGSKVLVYRFTGCKWVKANCGFICENCKQAILFGRFSSKVRYECPNHGIICKNCAETHFFRKTTCKECGSKVLVYQFTHNKWMKS